MNTLTTGIGKSTRKIKQGLLRQDIDDKHYLSWMGFEFAINELVKDYRKNDYKCVGVYGPPRGGLPIAVTLSHRLGVPLIKSEFKMLSTKERVLVVDDIADTGKTLERLKPLMGHDDVIYTIYYHKQSTVTPNAWVFEKKDDWVVFPWEEDIYGYETND